MNKKYTAIVLAVLLAVVEANTAIVNEKISKKSNSRKLRWDRLVFSVNINKYVDNAIKMSVPFIKAYDLDPMDLPDVEDEFKVKVLRNFTFSAGLRIHDGYMTGLMNVARSGDQTAYFFTNMLLLRLHFQFTNLELIYKYIVKLMSIGPNGGIVGSLNSFVVNIDLRFNFINDEIQLQEFSLTDIDRLRVGLTGNDLIDWLMNPVIGTFIRIYDSIIIKAVQTKIQSAVQDWITSVNSNVKDVIRAIEPFHFFF